MTGIEESVGSARSLGAPPLGHHLGAERRDHGPVVGAQPRPWHPQRHTGLVAPLLGQRPQPRVRRDATADEQVVDLVLRAGEQRLAGQHVDDRLLERRRDVGHGHRAPGPLLRLDPPRHRGLETREREVEAVPLEVAAGRQPAGKVDRDPVALSRSTVDVWSAREGQPEHPGDLVERLTRGVVHRRAERAHVVGDVGHEEQRAVPAGDEHRHRRLGQRPVLDDVDGDVRGQVVDAVDRGAERHGERLGRSDPDEQGSGQSRPGRHGDRVEVAEPDARVAAGPLDRRHHGLEVRPARDLGHDPSEAGVLLDAARDRVDEQGLAAHDADPGLVARRLDAEHQWLVAHASPSVSSRRMTRASTSPGW